MYAQGIHICMHKTYTYTYDMYAWGIHIREYIYMSYICVNPCMLYVCTRHTSKAYIYVNTYTYHMYAQSIDIYISYVCTRHTHNVYIYDIHIRHTHMWTHIQGIHICEYRNIICMHKAYIQVRHTCIWIHLQGIHMCENINMMYAQGIHIPCAYT